MWFFTIIPGDRGCNETLSPRQNSNSCLCLSVSDTYSSKVLNYPIRKKLNRHDTWQQRQCLTFERIHCCKRELLMKKEQRESYGMRRRMTRGKESFSLSFNEDNAGICLSILLSSRSIFFLIIITPHLLFALFVILFVFNSLTSLVCMTPHRWTVFCSPLCHHWC